MLLQDRLVYTLQCWIYRTRLPLSFLMNATENIVHLLLMYLVHRSYVVELLSHCAFKVLVCSHSQEHVF
jgi:hypothetical protein